MRFIATLLCKIGIFIFFTCVLTVFNLLANVCLLNAEYITPYLIKKKYSANFLEKGYFYIYKKDNLLIQFQEYNGFFSIDDSLYRLTSLPLTDTIGLKLSKKDFDFFKFMLTQHEKKATQKKIAQQKQISKKIEVQKVIPKSKKKAKKKVNVIIIDAGHGGKDPGAVAYGFLEKDFALLIAKEIGDRLKQKYNLSVLLTRTNDNYLSLEERCHIANSSLKEKENSIFVSIHLNTWFNPNTSGFEIYYLGLNKEITSARIYAHVEDIPFNAKMTNLKNINPYEAIFSRLEIMQYQKESQFIAKTILNSIQKNVRHYTIQRGIKTDLFYVLKGVLMPAVLLEVGFVSNKKDLEFINTKSTRKQLIDSIAAGIFQYVKTFEQESGFLEKIFLN